MVTAYVQLLARRYGGKLDSEAQRYIDTAVTGAARIESLLRGLRDYWQVSEATERAPAAVDCNVVVDRALAHLDASIHEAGAIVLREPLPVVMADEIPLVQLFQNLISNAIRYRRPGRQPVVEIRALPAGSAWRFAVHDNGIGIDPQYSQQIFGIFKRLDARNSGAGIGLAICQKIVERLGGRIWVESNDGAGSTFYFTVPDEPPEFATDSSRAPAAGTHL
jgi:light-regulated signal transduction histidine kinase (bacteriophytochrome)